jgi:oligopeptide transport system substrate-binding protein
MTRSGFLDDLFSNRRQFLFAGSSALAVAACSRDEDFANRPDPREPGVLYRVNDDEVGTLDPHKASTVVEDRVAHDLHAALATYQADGSIGPGLAEGWTTSTDGLTWTFTLRPGLTFSDGVPITAQTVVYSFRRLLSPTTASPFTKMYYAITNAEDASKGKADVSTIGVAAQGERTIVFTLREPFPSLAEVVGHSSSSIVPRHIIDKHGGAWMRPENIVVSGPFKLKRWVLQSALELEPNPRFYAASEIKLKRVVYYPISDDQTAIRRFRAKEVDVVLDFPTSQLKLLRREVPDAIRTPLYRGTYYFVFNTRMAPFNDLRVRRAMSMIVDRDIITQKVLPMGFLPACSTVPPNLGGYGPPVEPSWAQWPMERRVAEAKKLMAAAGYSEENPLVVELKYNTDDDHRRVCLALANMWKPLHVRVKLLNSEAAVHFAALKKADFVLARSGWIADYSAPETFLALYQSTTLQLNYPGYNNAAYDGLMRQALAEPDVPKRIALMRQAEALFVEDSPIVPIYFYRSKHLVSRDVKGWVENLPGQHLSRYLWVERGSAVAPAAS